MIAPIRETPPVRADRPRSEGMRRARRWIVKTLLVEHRPERSSDRARLHYVVAALWMVGIAAAWVGYVVLQRN